MSKLDDLLKQYEDEKAGIKPATSTNESANKIAGADKLKKMFLPQSAVEQFRIIFPNSAERHYEEAFFHKVKVNGEFKKLYCPKNNDGKPCPMCEKRDADLKAAFDAKHPKGSPESKAAFKLANLWEPKKFYIFKGVDKMRLGDGPKFWRIMASHDNSGDYDTIMDLVSSYNLETGNDFSDPLNGFDFKMKVGDKKTPNGVKYRGINRIDQADSSPLAMIMTGPKAGQPDTVKIEEILSDTLTWRDVFTANSINNLLDVYGYLKAAMEDRVPRWDSDKKRFIVKNEDGEEIEIDLRNPQGSAAPATPTKSEPIKVTKQSLQEATNLGDVEEDYSDLPF